MLKKFNLKKALAGEPVVTADSLKIIEIVRLAKMPSHSYNALVVVAKAHDGSVFTYNTHKSGRVEEFTTTFRDLFMVDTRPVKKPAPKKPAKSVEKPAARKKAR